MPIDFMMAMFLFLILLAYFFVVWDIFLENHSAHSSRTDAELAAIVISDQLVGHTGTPNNWTESPQTAQSLGLAIRSGELDYHKLSAFSTMQYAYAKQLLGTEKEFFIKVEDVSGVLIMTAGQEPGNVSRAVEVTRIAMLNGNAAFVRVQVYE